METEVSHRTSERAPRGRRWLWFGMLAVGIVLLGVGVFGFASAKRTDDGSRATKDRVAALQAETVAMTARSDQALAEANAARDEATGHDGSVRALQTAADDVETAAQAASDAANVLAGCEQLNTQAYLQCNRDGLEGSRTAVAHLVDTTDHLKDQMSKLEEDLR